MHINKVISYKQAWSVLNTKHSSEFAEINEAISDFINVVKQYKESPKTEYLNTRDVWQTALIQRGWILPNNRFRIETGSRISLSSLGPIKNEVSAAINQFAIIGVSDFLSRWLFQVTTLAIKHGFVQLPVLILPTSDFNKKINERRPVSANTFEYVQNQLLMLSPLSHHYPFVILGYSDEYIDIEVTELDQDPLLTTENKIIDRCIEFPPEYHQAGLNILNFFGTYLREQYPNENAKVKIEQHGLIVRLIIESNDGRSEVIEKALHEYQLIVSGSQPAETIVKNEKLVLEIRNELRIARYRIESQQDIISSQKNDIDKLYKLVEMGLANKNSVIIDFKPTINSTNNISINQNVSSVINNMDELRNLIPSSSDAYLVLRDLEDSMETIEKESNPDVVKNSSGMQKLKKFIENASDSETTIGKTVKAVETGWDIFKTLAGNYNKIAQWCGLPQVPTIFTK